MKSSHKDNILQIQLSIQTLIRDIEKEKINLHISQERNSKKIAEYNEILGRPVELNREQKLKMMKDRLEKLKKREIFSPTYGRKVRTINPEEELRMIHKSSSLNEIKLNDIKNDINKQALFNDKILHEINEIRRDKLLLQKKLTKIKEENEEIERHLNFLTRKNQNRTKKIKFQDLKQSKDDGLALEQRFKSKRDILEDKYHKIIEENIRRERLRNNELSKQRLANASFADNVRKKIDKNKKQEIKEDQDEIQDRMPILDSLLNKWNYIIKYKKQMINKYINYSSQIRSTFDKLILLLGLEKYGELPSIYEKNEEQIAQIDELLTKTITEVDELKAKKILLQKQIFILSENKKLTNEQKEQYIKQKKENIENLKKLNDELNEEISKKRALFTHMQECTFDFLTKMQNTYLVDYVVANTNVDENSKINETNVIDYLGSVYCYIQLINDFNESVQNKKMLIENNLSKSISLNTNIENLQKEIKFKLSKFNYKNCLSKVKDIKQKSTFDEVIIKLANDIVNEVNNNQFEKLHPYTVLNSSNEVTSDKTKVINNLRYHQEQKEI